MERKENLFIVLGSLKVGGVERLAIRLQKALSERGYNVYLVLLKNQVELSSYYPENILFLRTENYSTYFLKTIMALYNLWIFNRKYTPSKVISLSSGINVLLLFSFLPRLVFRVDTNLFAVKNNLYNRRILKIVGWLPNVKKVVVPSDQLRMAFKNYLPRKSFKKFITIPNPIDQENQKINDFEMKPRKKYVLISIGRLTRSKGFDQLIKCFSKANFNSDVELWIIGSGPKEKELELLIKTLDQERKIKLLGFQKNTEYFLKRADALILNTEFESFGNVFIESLMCGVPAISNDCDFGPREIIIHGENGLLYDNSRDENLIAVMESYINEDTLRNKIIANRPFDMKKFKTETVASIWVKEILN